MERSSFTSQPTNNQSNPQQTTNPNPTYNPTLNPTSNPAINTTTYPINPTQYPSSSPFVWPQYQQQHMLAMQRNQQLPIQQQLPYMMTPNVPQTMQQNGDQLQLIMQSLANQNAVLANIAKQSNDRNEQHKKIQSKPIENDSRTRRGLRSEDKYDNDSDDDWDIADIEELTKQQIQEKAWHVLGIMVEYNTTGKQRILHHSKLSEYHLGQIMSFLKRKKLVEKYGSFYRKKSYLKLPDIKHYDIYDKLQRHYKFTTNVSQKKTKKRKRTRYDTESDDESDFNENDSNWMNVQHQNKKIKFTEDPTNIIHKKLENDNIDKLSTLFNKNNLKNISSELDIVNQKQSEQIKQKLYIEQQQKKILENKLKQLQEQNEELKKQKNTQSSKGGKRKKSNIMDNKSESKASSPDESNDDYEPDKVDNNKQNKGRSMASKSLSDLHTQSHVHPYPTRSKFKK